MIDGLYDIAIDTPKYHRRGTIRLKSVGAEITAELNVADHECMAFSGTCVDKEFDFVGSADLPSIGQGDYKAHGSVWGNSITIACETVAGKVEMFGTQLSSAAGDPRSSHEYVMRASTGDLIDDGGAMYSGLYADGG